MEALIDLELESHVQKCGHNHRINKIKKLKINKKTNK